MFPDMYLQYNHPTNKSQQKPFDKNRQSPTTSTTAPMPHTIPTNHKETQPLQPSTTPLMTHHLPAHHKKTQPPQPSSAALMAHHLPANHKETQPLQPSSAALMAHTLPANHHTSHPQKTERTDCQRDGCMVVPRYVGVSRWSYLAPEASDA